MFFRIYITATLTEVSIVLLQDQTTRVYCMAGRSKTGEPGKPAQLGGETVIQRIHGGS
nr:hypothetical protein Iba_chr14aCG11340 [Ipomoea batatas]